jgi:tetratricopeptide (TPR) repeat protein
MTRSVLGSFSLALFGAILAAPTAHADWVEASSDYFVIYGDMKEKAATQFAERLERFNAAMARVHRHEQPKPSPSNRVTVYVVASREEVQEVTAVKNRDLAGIYIPRAGGSVAVVPKLKGPSSQFDLSGEMVLYHEYAHHFMKGFTRRAYPRWFVEGFAEFFAGVRFKANGDVDLGMPAYHRVYELAQGRKVPIRSLLEFDGGAGDSKSGFDSFYGQSWALFHYLQMAPERTGQIDKYAQQLAAGTPAVQAAEAAFGDLSQLDKDTQRYLKKRTASILRLRPEMLTIGTVAVRKLGPGEAAMMPVTIESNVGVNEEEAKALVPEARKVAARYPDDAAVLSALAEAELDAGNDDEAIAAADRALAIDAKQVNAHIQKGYALSRKVRSGALPATAWKDVRNQFAKANQAENDHPVPLVQFYLSYKAQGLRPTKNAIDGLVWAMELAPFDGSLRWIVAQQMISDERLKDAASALAPLAYSPHPGEHTDKARELLKDVEERLAKASEGSSSGSEPAAEQR